MKPDRLILWNLVAIAVAWVFAPTLQQLAVYWEQTAEYSHGWLILLFAIGLLWHKFQGSHANWATSSNFVAFGLGGVGLALWLTTAGSNSLLSTIGILIFAVGVGTCAALWLPDQESSAVGGEQVDAQEAAEDHQRLVWRWRISQLLGWTGLLFGLGLRVASGFYFIEWGEQLSLIPTLLGLGFLFGGFAVGWRLVPLALFLFFIVPLPFRLETALREPLREFATKVSTYLLQAFGLPAFAEGFVITLGEHRLGVAEACSGLSMLMVFFALTVGLVLSAKRPLWQNVVIVASTIPIALAANVLRIVATALFHNIGLETLADMTLHDLAGWAMMPVGVALLALELWYLDRLVIEEEKRPMGIGLDTMRAGLAR